MPRFLYPAGHVYNPENENDGLFEGHVFVYVSIHFQFPITV